MSRISSSPQSSRIEFSRQIFRYNFDSLQVSAWLTFIRTSWKSCKVWMSVSQSVSQSYPSGTQGPKHRSCRVGKLGVQFWHATGAYDRYCMLLIQSYILCWTAFHGKNIFYDSNTLRYWSCCALNVLNNEQRQRARKTRREWNFSWLSCFRQRRMIHTVHTIHTVIYSTYYTYSNIQYIRYIQ